MTVAPREVAAVAKAQHGLITRAQLLELGMSPDAIDRRVASGYLHAVHRGVYAVGHLHITRWGVWLAALLASGPGAVLSHLSAGELWGLVDPRRGGEATHVTVAGRHLRGRPGLVAHRGRAWLPGETVAVNGVAVTTAPRTLVDVATSLGEGALADALDRAERDGRLGARQIERIRAANSGRPGVARLGRALELRRAGGRTRSSLERSFVRFCRRRSLPRPATNVIVNGFEVDALFAAERVVVELDSFEFHRARDPFERDRERDVAHQLAGFRVMRLTSRRLREAPDRVERELRALLGLR